MRSERLGWILLVSLLLSAEESARETGRAPSPDQQAIRAVCEAKPLHSAREIR
jgi:hypothetical protein